MARASRLASLICLSTVAAFGLLPPVGNGPARAQTVTGDELRAELSGNTLTGFHDSGMSFTEYHAPDGRVFGFNGGEPAREACWRVRGDAVCYGYGRGRITGEFCWRFDRVGSVGYRIAHLTSGTKGIARLENGNPKNLSDHGEPWDCADQISRRGESPRLAAR